MTTSDIDPVAVLAEVLNTQPWRDDALPERIGLSRHVNHQFDADCAICKRDVGRIAQVAAEVAEGIAEERAARAYSTSGNVLDPEDLETVLSEHAAQLADQVRTFNAAMRTGRTDEMRYPFGLITDMLAVVSALAAVLGYKSVPTAPAVLDELRAERTYNDNALRLHLASEHDDLVILGASDQEAAHAHDAAHAEEVLVPEGYVEHPLNDRTWDEQKIRKSIADHAYEWDPHQFQVPLTEHIALANAAAGFTPAADRMRLHLLSAHRNLAALGLTDAEAAEQHDDEHTGPGGLRDHDPANLFWDDATITEMIEEDGRGFLTEEDRDTIRRRYREHFARISGGATPPTT